MEIQIIDSNLARCKSNSRYGNGERCNYKSLSETDIPSGRSQEDGSYFCKPARTVLRLPILQEGQGPGSMGTDALIATEQIKGCDMFEPCSRRAIKLNGPSNLYSDKPSTCTTCEYCAPAELTCRYLESFGLGDAPTGWEFGNCKPKREILRQKSPGPLAKLRMIDQQTELDIAEAQQRKCDKYSPRLSPREPRQNPRFAVDRVYADLSDKIQQRVESAGMRSGVFGDIIRRVYQIADIEEASVITGITDLNDIDTFLLQTTRDAIERLGITPDDKPFSVDTTIKSFLAKLGFNGQFREISPVLVVNNLSELAGQPPTPNATIIQLLIETGLYSSAQKERAGTYVGSAQLMLSRATKPKIITKCQHLTKASDLDQLTLMLAQSRATFEAVYEERIRNAVSAGLPSLGRQGRRR